MKQREQNHITAPLCDSCWQRRFPSRERPIRVPIDRRREATCASCYAPTYSGIFVFQSNLEQPTTKENPTMTTKKKYLAKTIRKPDGTYQPFIGTCAWACTHTGCRNKAAWIIVNEDRTRTAGGRCNTHANFVETPLHPDEKWTRAKKADPHGDGRMYSVDNLSWVCTVESFPDEDKDTVLCDDDATWFVIDEDGRCTDEGLCERHKYKHPIRVKEQRKHTFLLSKKAKGRPHIDNDTWVCTRGDCPTSGSHHADWYVVNDAGYLTPESDGVCDAWRDAHSEWEIYEDDKDLV